MDSSEQTGAYVSAPLKQADFWQGGFLHIFLSEYFNQSHNFPNLNFCDVTLLFAIKFSQRKLPKGKKQIASETRMRVHKGSSLINLKTL